VDVGSVSGANLLVGDSATFDAGIGPWVGTFGGGTPTWDSVNQRLIVNVSSAFQGAGVTVTGLTIGRTYYFALPTVTLGTATSYAAYLSLNGGGGNNGAIGVSGLIWTATQTSAMLAVQVTNAGGGTLYVDNVSIRDVVADRSYKSQAATITGTLTKSQVA
jgi:hypothetical protein